MGHQKTDTKCCYSGANLGRWEGGSKRKRLGAGGLGHSLLCGEPGREVRRGVGGVAGGGRGGRGEGQAASRKAGGGWQTEADQRDRKKTPGRCSKMLNCA